MDSKFLEAISLAVVEILGQKDAVLIFKKIGVYSNTMDSETFSGIHFSLEELGQALAKKYDDQIAKGLMIRIGRASLTFLRRFFQEIAELGKIENRLKPLDKRFPYSLNVLAGKASSELGEAVKLLIKSKLAFEWQINAASGQVYMPYYHFGLLEEFCYWLDARKYYQLSYADGEGLAGTCRIGLEVKEME